MLRIYYSSIFEVRRHGCCSFKELFSLNWNKFILGKGTGGTSFQEMSANKSRKRVGVTEDAIDKGARRVRKPIKIEVEKDAEESFEEHSKYFAETAKVSPKKEEEESKPETGEGSTLEVEDGSPGKKKARPSPMKVKLEPPDNWEMIMENIKKMRSSKTAVVDTMGCERTADLDKEPKVQRFHTLVSLMLSSQTKDQITYAAMTRLKDRDLTVQSMLDVDETELGEILKPVSFYRRKSTYIKQTCKILRSQYDDDIPKTVEDLCKLPGVGQKMAYICMNAAWKENVGIGVDTHVHRICNRFNWTGKNGTKTPEKTREALESWLPQDQWQEFNILLVGFGQETCHAVKPKCESCLNKDICPASTTRGSKSKKKKATKKS